MSILMRTQMISLLVFTYEHNTYKVKKKRLLRHCDATVETHTGGNGGEKAASLTAHHWLWYWFKFRVWPMSSGVAKATLSLNVNFR